MPFEWIGGMTVNHCRRFLIQIALKGLLIANTYKYVSVMTNTS